MIHELRVYHAVPGRLNELIERFAQHTIAIFQRHDIRPLSFWTGQEAGHTNDLYYLLEWDDLAHQQRAMAAFRADPQWHEVRERTEAHGALITGTEFTLLSPITPGKT